MLDGLERRSAALLAYLALEGPTPRSRLAGLLWPDSTEDAARANLRQRLKRLRELLGTEIVLPDETLRLRPDLEVDTVQLESLAFTGEYEAALRLDGALLSGHDYDDCPDLEAWVLSARERLTNARREALSALCERAEGGGEYALALGYAERLIRADPISEDAHRRAMRLQFLAGDRSAALSAFERCREVLLRELGLEPLPETVELASLIAGGSQLPDLPAPIRSSIPISVLRPPVLAGREREWARLEAAWAARQVAFIGGPPGCGKTRLMMDFAASKGGISPLEGRPGDDGVPYSTHARSLRRFLASSPEALSSLEPWVRRELSRLAPELQAQAAPPIRDEAEKLRFFQAVAHLTGMLAGHGIASIVLDDLQFMDAGSFEVGAFITARSLEDATHRGWPRSLNAFRSGELPPEIAARVRELVESGAAILIELEPLGTEAVSAMLDGIQVAGLDGLAPAMVRYTGGNPLFIVETVKHLIETEQLEQAKLTGALPMRLLPPGKVGGLIRRRLERLTPGALRLAQAAAVAGADFDLELGARVLQTDALELTQAVVELEAAQVMRGNAFAHDLIQEATLEGVPNTIRTLLHRRVAEHLETVSVAPSRVAHHWLEAGDQQKAVPHLMEAGRAAEAAYRLPEAIAAFERAGDMRSAQNRPTEAFEAFLAARSLLRHSDTGAHLESLIGRLIEHAQTPKQRALAWSARAELQYERGDFLEAERMARRGLTHALESGDEQTQAELANVIAGSVWQLGRREEAARAFEEVCSFFERAGLEPELSDALNNLGFACDNLDRYAEARAHYRRALELVERHGIKPLQAIVLNNLSFNLRAVGRCREAIPILEAAQTIVSEIEGNVDGQRRTLFHLGSAWFERADYRRGFALLNQALELSRANSLPEVFMIARLVGAYLGVGQDEVCERLLNEVEGQPATLNSRAVFRRTLAQLRQRQGRRGEALGLLNDAEAILGASASRTERARLNLVRCTVLPLPASLELAREILETARVLDLGGLQVAAHARIAQGSLALNSFQAALEHASAAVNLLEAFDPEGLSRAEILSTHHRALEANRHPEARAALERAYAWVLETADQRVPPEYRDSFLTRNPVNAAILEAARAAQLA